MNKFKLLSISWLIAITFGETIFSQTNDLARVTLGNWKNNTSHNVLFQDNLGLATARLKPKEMKNLNLGLVTQQNPGTQFWFYVASAGVGANHIKIRTEYYPEKNKLTTELQSIVGGKTKVLSQQEIVLEKKDLKKVTVFINGDIEGENLEGSKLKIMKK